MSDLTLVEGPNSGSGNERLANLAALLGIPTRPLRWSGGPTMPAAVLRSVGSGPAYLAMSGDTFGQLEWTEASELREMLAARCAALLVYGCTGTPAQAAAVSCVTRGAVVGVSPALGHAPQIALTRSQQLLTRQLAGAQFIGAHGDVVSTFQPGRSTLPPGAVIALADRQPTFVRFPVGSCEVFLSASPVPDVSQTVHRHDAVDRHFDLLIPLVVFLRYCFGESCWHAPMSTARLTIDDPLIDGRYGFLQFPRLVASMNRARYGATVCFIPWNHRRTSRRSVSRFLSDSERLSVCVHGCDHVKREFASSDEPLLRRRASLALRRMDLMRARTGAAYDRVMVFPQGLFSLAAVSALRASGFVAAVNSSCVPIDAGPDALTLADLLRPAVSRFDGFPVFFRRDLGPVEGPAFDLFMGRPALLLAHHDDFRGGFGALEELVTALRGSEPALTWPSLERQLTRTCWQRRRETGEMEIEFFTRVFFLPRSRGSPVKWLLRKHEPAQRAVRDVLVDGASVPFWFEGESLRFELPQGARPEACIEIVDWAAAGEASGGFGLAYNAGVLARRLLSEFRDNTLSRHDGLARAARAAARAMRLTGDS